MGRIVIWGVWILLVLCTSSASAAPLISGYAEGFRNRFNWRVYAADAVDNPHPKPDEFTYIYWQQAMGGEIPLYSIGLIDGVVNDLGLLTETGFIPQTGSEPDAVAPGLWSWDDFTLGQAQRTASLFVTSPNLPGQIGALVYNCDPVVCTRAPTTSIGPVDPSPPLGDYNLNGIVGVEDFAAWKVAFGTANYAADGNKNGNVDAGDYAIWRDHLGTTNGGVELTASAVPEPVTGMLLALCAACSLAASRRTPRGRFR